MSAIQNYQAYQEVVDFIASSNPAKVLAFKPSEAAKQRVSELIEREKNEGLSAEETSELDYYMKLEHLMRMAKIKAHQYSK
ncbi:MAG TPA: hypothetical protein PKE69_02380 [Pyrinomonadaceae bacterium]|nr:hypothetical protein [Pyrinomonadaceae bacterium]